LRFFFYACGAFEEARRKKQSVNPWLVGGSEAKKGPGSVFLCDIFFFFSAEFVFGSD
jgi:hypothetical protein